MNVTELARRLKVPTEQLREMLPQLGFDIGKKAIKIDDIQAHRIIQNWSRLKKQWEFEQAKLRKHAEEKTEFAEKEEKKEVFVPEYITVRDFAKIIDKPVSIVISQLMKNGIFASLNEKIDYETASIIGDDLGVEVKKQEGKIIEDDSTILEKIIEEDKDKLKPRPPVIVVMGHVDHGKTLLLDTIRKTNVVAGEAGGITQSIGAYQVEKNGKKITFIDTPGHEAFTAMRSRGANVADIAILVVAVDDSVKPQTVESLKIIEKSKLPMIVAINKIDKEDANIERVKKDLSNYNLIPEEWGGNTIVVEVSALTGQGIDNLLDHILLLAELEKENMMANPNRNAIGTIIESHIDKHEGPVATVLVQAGTLKLADKLTIKGEFFGKVRAMKDWKGNNLTSAAPSTPVKILGFKILPKVGDIVEAATKLKIRRTKKIIKNKYQALQQESIIKTIKKEETDDSSKVIFNIVLKADVLGMLEAIIESLEKIEQEKVKISIVSKGLGNVTENDINAAKTSNAFLVAFNVGVSPEIKKYAQVQGVNIHQYKIIYKLLEDVKENLKKIIEPEIVIKHLGEVEVLAVFRREKNAQVIGGKVISGIVKQGVWVNVFREGIKLLEGKVSELQSGRQKVSIVEEGQECGIKFEGDPMIEVGDILQFYEKEQKEIEI